MAFTLLNIKFDLDFGPKALDSLCFIPGSNFEFDAPWDSVTLLIRVHDYVQRLSFRCVAPFFDSSIAVCGCLEAYGGL